MSKEIINIKVVQKTINDEKKRFVNARELYEWLKSKRQFADWIKDRIEKYDFIENIDYFAVHKIVKGVKTRADGMLIDEKTGQI
ncbi:antA/AntB antirepressor family protein, partial [Patescibacteria group bacterium]|nr:antA/AntB antirepressor family protein [Patescibacteria group bacterium]